MFRARRIGVSDDARADLRKAVLWFSMQDTPGLDEKFLQAYVDALDVIRERATTFPVVWKTMRRAIMDPFPYGVFFEVDGDAVHVLGVIHLHSDPRRWKERA